MRTAQNETWTRLRTADQFTRVSGREQASEYSAWQRSGQPFVHLLEQLLELRLGAPNTL
jgi:hypothetical protein